MSMWGWVFLAYVCGLVPVSALWWRAGRSAGWEHGYDTGRAAGWAESQERLRQAVHVREPFGGCSCGREHAEQRVAREWHRWNDQNGVVS